MVSELTQIISGNSNRVQQPQRRKHKNLSKPAARSTIAALSANNTVRPKQQHAVTKSPSDVIPLDDDFDEF